MSRRCRASLIQGAGGAGGDLSSGCSCGRLGGGIVPPPCEEPLVYGGNVLPNSGFERQLELGENGGPLGDEFPWYDQGTFPIHRWVSSGGVAHPTNGSWIINTDASGQDRQFLSSADPAVGAFHARAVTPSTTLGRSSFMLRPTGFFVCALEDGAGYPVSARVNEGDLVVFNMSAKYATDGVGPVGQIRFDQSFYFFISGVGGYPGLSPVTETQDLTTTYASYTPKAFFAPPALSGFPPFYYSVSYKFIKPATGAAEVYTFDADNAQLTVLQAGQNILLCAQSGLITIDNSTVETAFL